MPYFLGAQQGQQVGVQQRQPFLDYLAEYWPRMGYFARPVLYGLQLPLLLAAASIFAVRSRRLVVLLLCWATVAALFLLAGSRIAMVDKQVFYLVPALALLAGSLLGRLWSRGAAARLVVAGVYLLTLTAAIELWLFRIMSTQQ
ncbi:MAG: hypothetical protein IPO81_24870 [Kouleothrix sp.]|nr:hypothetical protein [Kouleothrix sp.]